MNARVPGPILALLLLTAHGGPASAAAAEPVPPPTLGSLNTVTGAGTTAMDVVLPDGASFVLRSSPPRSPGWATLSGDGSFVALALVSKTHTLNAGAHQVNLLQVWMPRPHGCTYGGTCLEPYDHVFFQTATAPRFEDGSFLYDYPPGSYRLYLLTDPGKTAAASFELRGPSGDVSLQPAEPAAAHFAMRRSAGPAATVLSGSMRSATQGPGFVTVGMSHVADGSVLAPGTFSYQECLTRGGPAPLNPDDCLPAAVLTPTTGEVHAAGQPVLLRPSIAAGSFGGFTLTPSGLGTWESPTLPPAEWVNSFRIQRGGIDPAIDAWALWLEF